MNNHYITLGYNGALSVGRYAAIVRAAKADPARRFSRSFCSWAPATGATILREFREMVTDLINRHLPNPKGWGRARLERHAMRHGLRSECRWCGSKLDLWTENREAHFCDAGCRHDYYS